MKRQVSNLSTGSDGDNSTARLLRALSGAGAYGFEEAGDGPSRVIVAAARNGVSLRAGVYPVAAAARLCGDDLAQWRGEGAGRRRLVLTDAGRARLARENAPDGHDPFAAQHASLIRGPADSHPDAAMVVHDQEESPLGWLATRKGRDGLALIDPVALEAGERLRRDLTFAQILPRVTANWTSTVSAKGSGGGPAHVADMALAARQRVEQALTAVGPDFAGLLVDVCGFLKGLELIETERRWPRRSAKVVLVLALNQLCRHYGLSATARGPEQSSGPRHWGAGDFRPVLARP